MSIVFADLDSDLLGGRHGPAAQFAMTLLVRFAEAVGASKFIDAEAAHIDGCLYHGQVSLDFVERVVRARRTRPHPDHSKRGFDRSDPPGALPGGRRSPGVGRPPHARPRATRLCPDLYLRSLPNDVQAPFWCADRLGGIERNRVRQLGHRGPHQSVRRLCRPLLCAYRPGTVLRSARDREPAGAYSRRPAVPTEWLDATQTCVAVGYLIGRLCGERIPAIVGLPEASEDDLKALGAVAASAGAVGMFHAVGVTPEADTLHDAFQGSPPEETIELGPDDLRGVIRSLSTVSDGAALTAVNSGRPISPSTSAPGS